MGKVSSTARVAEPSGSGGMWNAQWNIFSISKVCGGGFRQWYRMSEGSKFKIFVGIFWLRKTESKRRWWRRPTQRCVYGRLNNIWFIYAEETKSEKSRGKREKGRSDRFNCRLFICTFQDLWVAAALPLFSNLNRWWIFEINYNL